MTISVGFYQSMLLFTNLGGDFIVFAMLLFTKLGGDFIVF